LTDPRHDKKRIEDTKGGLLADSYQWVLDNPEFKCWRDSNQSRLLWVKGDPGKGKTMLLCGIINELSGSTRLKDQNSNVLLSYFFCQATDSRINNACSVMRGLIFMLVDQQPTLISHIRKRYDQAGKQLFEDANAWTALTEILTDILNDPRVASVYLVIDGLDECSAFETTPGDRQQSASPTSDGLSNLLETIVQNSTLPNVKWIVSSRNWPVIEEVLDRATEKIRLNLELNQAAISAAVGIYIDWKVKQLALVKKYDTEITAAVRQHLLLNAHNTFLWVALVCHELASLKVRRHHTIAKLRAFPPGLDHLYRRMITQISDSDDSKLCTTILATVATVYEPITLDELVSFVDIPAGATDDTSLKEIIELCGSFLTLRYRKIFFVHQSAKDFLVNNASANILASGMEDVHHVIFSRSLQLMSKTLRRNLYNFNEPGISIEQIELLSLTPDPLETTRYSCIYWVDHLNDCNSSEKYATEFGINSQVDKFLLTHYLHWLETLSLLRGIPNGIVSMAKLAGLVDVSLDTLLAKVQSPNLPLGISIPSCR
jgi:hypothetical protein